MTTATKSKTKTVDEATAPAVAQEAYPESLIEIKNTERVSIAPRNTAALSNAQKLVASFTTKIEAREALRAELVAERESGDPRQWFVAKGALSHSMFDREAWTDGTPKNGLDRGLQGAERQVEELMTGVTVGVAVANALTEHKIEDADTGRPVIPETFPIVVAGGKVPEASEQGVIYVVASNEVVHTESAAEAVAQIVVDCDPDYRPLKVEKLGLLLQWGDISPRTGGRYSCQTSTSTQGKVRRTVVTVNNGKPVLWRDGSWSRKVSEDLLDELKHPSALSPNLVR